MDKQSLIKRIVLISIIIVFCLLCLFLYLFIELNQGGNISNLVSVTTAGGEEKNSIPEVIEKYESEYILEDNNNIYVKFSKDLYDKDGNSNKKFFTDLVGELEKFFYVTDNTKNIKIYAKYDRELEEHIIIINDVENYYDNTNGEDFTGVEDINYAILSTDLKANCSLFKKLVNSGMQMGSIEEELGDGIELDNGYISYLDGKVKIRKLKKNLVGNIIIDRSYPEQIFKNFENDAILEEIVDEDPNYCFGSPEEEFLGYRTNGVYYFIYDDEISMYGYSYLDNFSFEKDVSNYIKDKDFESFVTLLTNQMPLYDYAEYDAQNKNANIMYSLYGFEVNIENNDPKGIILYSNYYFTKKSTSWVKNGLVTFKNDENSVEKIEVLRRLKK